MAIGMPSAALPGKPPAHGTQCGPLSSVYPDRKQCRTHRAGNDSRVSPESRVAGYPSWIWWLRPGSDGALTGEIHAVFSTMPLTWTLSRPIPNIQSRIRVFCH